jgi:alpha-beta hydrolase superfamily lysophospholipase
MQADGKPDLETMVERASLRLHVEHYMPSSDPRLVLVMVHGFSAHCGLYRHVGRALANRGIAVTQFDSRGHGRSGGQRGHVDNFADYLDDLEAIIAWARARNPRVPWALMGHSMGGAVSAALVLDGGRNIRPKCLVLAAPWLKLKMKVSAPKANVVAKVVPTQTWPSGLVAEDVSRNPIVRAGFHDDPLVHHVASAGWFMAMLHAQAKIRASASNLRVPTLLLLAGEDRIVANEVNQAFATAAGSWVEARRYQELYHELFLEPEVDTVVADIGTWLLDSVART